MKFEYQRINIESIKGIKQAEKLQSSGWKIIQSGFTFILFERIKK